MIHRYADTLISLRADALGEGKEFLTWNDVQKCVDTVNVQVHEEHERKRPPLHCLRRLVQPAPQAVAHFSPRR